MTKIRIPLSMQVYIQEREVVHVSAKNVRQVINELEKDCPGMKDTLMDNDGLRPDVAVMLDGKISQLGLLQPLAEENEVIFLPAISGS